MENPYNFIAMDHIKRITGFEIIPSQVSEEAINHYINQLYRNDPIESITGIYESICNLPVIPKAIYLIIQPNPLPQLPIVRLVDSLDSYSY